MRPGETALAAGYFTFFAAVGVFQPYWPLWLAGLGFRGAEIGLLLGVFSAVRLVAPLAAASVADQRGERRGAIVALALAAALAAVALGRAEAPGPMAVTLALFSAALNGLTPVYDAYALECLGRDAHRYGLLRLWGSIGFVIASTAVGGAVARCGNSAIPAALVTTLAATVLAAMMLPRSAPRVATPAPGLAAFARSLRDPALLRFLTIAFLHLAGFAGYYAFYTLYLRLHGYGATVIGLYWAFGVVAEIAMFAAGPRLLRLFRLDVLLRIALAGTCLRWVLVAGLADSRLAMFAAQSLHLLGFGLFHTVAVLLAPRLLPGGGPARAQALVAVAGWGAGGFVGSLVAGLIWEAAGPQAVFGGAGVAALGAFLLSLTPLEAPRRGLQ